MEFDDERERRFTFAAYLWRCSNSRLRQADMALFGLNRDPCFSTGGNQC